MKDEVIVYVSAWTLLAALLAICVVMVVFIRKEERKQRARLVKGIDRLLLEGEATPAQLARALVLNEAKVRTYLLDKERDGYVTSRWHTPATTVEPRDRYYHLSGK